MNEVQEARERLISYGTVASCSHYGIEPMHQQQGRADDRDSDTEVACGNHTHACSQASCADVCNSVHCRGQALSAPEQRSADAAAACSNSYQQHAASFACHEHQQCDDAAPLIVHRHRSCSDALDSTSAMECSSSPTSQGSRCNSDARSTDGELFEVVVDGACMVADTWLQACTWCCQLKSGRDAPA